MSELKWTQLTSIEQLDEIDRISHEKPVVIFKHSTRCSISAASLSRLERKWEAVRAKGAVPYFLDLIPYRAVSDEIVTHYGVVHQSPQVLVISEGKCIYSATHFGIAFEDISENITSLSA